MSNLELNGAERVPATYKCNAGSVLVVKCDSGDGSELAVEPADDGVLIAATKGSEVVVKREDLPEFIEVLKALAEVYA